MILDAALEDRIHFFPSVEVSPVLNGHINPYPVDPEVADLPNGGATRWWAGGGYGTEELFDLIHTIAPIIQINHGRSATSFFNSGEFDPDVVWPAFAGEAAQIAQSLGLTDEQLPGAWLREQAFLARAEEQGREEEVLYGSESISAAGAGEAEYQAVLGPPCGARCSRNVPGGGPGRPLRREQAILALPGHR